MAESDIEEKYNLDKKSQLMLLQFYDRDESLGSGDLTGPARVDDNDYNKVKYRLRAHLVPNGFVREVDPVKIGGQERKRWKITTAGKELVENRREEMEVIPEVDEIAADAADAVQEAESAKDSVQKYRKEVSRLKTDLEEFDERLDDFEDAKWRMEGVYAAIWNEYPIKDHHEEIDSLQEKVSDLERSLDSLERQINSLLGELERTASENALKSQVRRLDSLAESHNQLAEEFEEHR